MAPAGFDGAPAHHFPSPRHRLRLPPSPVLPAPLQPPAAPRPRRRASAPPRRRRPTQASIRYCQCPDQCVDQASPTRRLKLDTFSPTVLTQAGLEASSLTPIRPIGERIWAWKEITGKVISFYNFDVAENYHRLLTLIVEWRPDAIVHFAEQRAAPYSMKSSYHKRYTVNNNLNATNNLLAAIVESGVDSHVVHLGTMGVYGYSAAGVKIPEGYLPIKLEEDGKVIHREILYPADPGSIYHLTKTQDQLLFAFYNKIDAVRVTDLHQGIVWGTQTEETSLDERLINRFDYDGDYGTVLNRFLVQAAIGFPLTVHGTGGQTPAFIHIHDNSARVGPPSP